MTRSGAPAASWRSRLGLGVIGVLLIPAVIVVTIIVFPFLAGEYVVGKLRLARLRRRFRARWKGKAGLLVYSNSPHWQAYIEERWLPLLEPHLVVLNWSERQEWPRRHPLEAELFRRHLGQTEYNPAAVLIPAKGRVRVIRFWQAFRDCRHGKDRALRAAEAELFAALGVTRNPFGSSPHGPSPHDG